MVRPLIAPAMPVALSIRDDQPMLHGKPEKHDAAIPVDVRILEAAAVHIRKFGPDKTRIVDIAAETGMSHANIYRYFPSKTALFDAVTAHWLRPVEIAARIIVEGPDPAPDKLERLLSATRCAYRDKLERDPALFALLAKAATLDSGIARKHRLNLQSAVQRTIEAGFAQRNFHQNDLRRALPLVFDMCHRFLHPAAIALDAGVARSQIDLRAGRVTQLLLQALATGRY